MKVIENLLTQFIEHTKRFHAEIEPIKILRSNAYRVGKANVLIRTASDLGKRFFFGLNYITAEEIFNLDNSFVAFICGSIDRVVLLPSDILMKLLPQISHDRNGEYKINLTRNLELVLKGKGNSYDCSSFINNWSLLATSVNAQKKFLSPDESFHTIIQGRLIEIGNNRGYETYCPDKKKKFNRRPLGEISTLNLCPELQFSEHRLLRKIDVIWFREISKGFYPEYAFEVELTTGTWPGFVRLASLREYNTRLCIISSDEKRFTQTMDTFPDMRRKYMNIVPENIGLLYSAELHLLRMREEFNI